MASEVTWSTDTTSLIIITERGGDSSVRLFVVNLLLSEVMRQLEETGLLGFK